MNCQGRFSHFITLFTIFSVCSKYKKTPHKPTHTPTHTCSSWVVRGSLVETLEHSAKQIRTFSFVILLRCNSLCQFMSLVFLHPCYLQYHHEMWRQRWATYISFSNHRYKTSKHFNDVSPVSQQQTSTEQKGRDPTGNEGKQDIKEEQPSYKFLYKDVFSGRWTAEPVKLCLEVVWP